MDAESTPTTNDTNAIPPPPTPHIPSDESTKASFEELIQSFHIALEETRRFAQSKKTKDDDALFYEEVLPHLRHLIIDVLYPNLMQLNSFIQNKEDNVENAMIENCRSKTVHLLQNQILKEYFCSKRVVDDFTVECQACVAQLFEISLRCEHFSASKSGKTVELYSQYQKQVLRNRCKPSIATLVKYRTETKDQNVSFFQVLQKYERQSEEENRPMDNHVHVITTILSQASLLIDPLLQWNTHLLSSSEEISETLMEMCTASIQILNEETETLVDRVATWFLQDYQIQSHWIPNAKAYHHRDSSKQTSDASQGVPSDISLDRVLEDIAFVCQLISRYNQFICVEERQHNPTPLQLLLSDLSGQYATLEDYYMASSFLKAMQLTSPVEIYDNVYVPSIVEDSFYLCQRSIHRSNETRDLQAMITICNRCVEMWSPEGGQLVRSILTGGGADLSGVLKQDAAPVDDQYHSFAAALLGAIDDDIPAPPSHVSTTSPFPTSLLSQICILNGIANASSACLSMSDLLRSILPEQHPEEQPLSKMLQFSIDELCGYARGYHILLKEKSQTIVEECNIFYPLEVFLSYQKYDLRDVGLFRREQEALESNVISKLRDNVLVRVVLEGYCDNDVVMELVKNISSTISSIFLNTILSPTTTKPFTDFGSILFAKQVRTLFDLFCEIILKTQEHRPQNKNVGTHKILHIFEKVNTAVTILQLEKPSDWSSLKYHNQKFDKDSKLGKEDLYRIMRLRVDFSEEAVKKACDL